ILSWCASRGLRRWFGNAQAASCFPMLDTADGREIYPFGLWASGEVEVQFQRLRPPFDREELRVELAERLERIPGVVIPRERLTGRPSFPMGALADEQALRRFFEVWEWCITTAED